jgi:hypothetical protein
MMRLGGTTNPRPLVFLRVRSGVAVDGLWKKYQLAEFKEPHLAMVFAAPYLPASKQADVENLLRQFVQELLQMRNVTLAWTFPKNARNLRPDDEDRDYVFPGIVLIIQKCA